MQLSDWKWGSKPNKGIGVQVQITQISPLCIREDDCLTIIMSREWVPITYPIARDSRIGNLKVCAFPFCHMVRAIVISGTGVFVKVAGLSSAGDPDLLYLIDWLVVHSQGWRGGEEGANNREDRIQLHFHHIIISTKCKKFINKVELAISIIHKKQHDFLIHHDPII